MSDIVDKIRAALDHIGSDNRSQWVEAAMAIKSELGDAGFEIWDEWSQSSESYNAKSAKSVWRTANASKIGIGTLFWRAQQNGFDLSEFRSDTLVDRAAIEAMAKKQREAREAQEAVRLEKQMHAAELATVVLKTAAPAGSDHPYLIKKGLGGSLTPQNLREIKAEKLAQVIGYPAKSDGNPLVGRILVGPVGDSAGVTTVEFVDESGQKAALAGGRKSAAWWAASPLVDNPDQVIVCEGIATASSIAAAELSKGRNSVVVAALSDTNLPNVAEVMRERYQSTRLVIASDLGNGEKKAQEAAEKTGAFYVVPSFPANATINGTTPTDFNDLHQISGLSDVAAFALSGKRLGDSGIEKSDNLEQSTTDRSDDSLSTVVQSAQGQRIISGDVQNNGLPGDDLVTAFRLGEQTAIETAQRRMDRFVSEFERGTLKEKDSQLLGDTPLILQYLGSPNHQLQIDGQTINKIVGEKHKHTMSAEDLRLLSVGIYDPLMVFDSPDTRTGAPGKLMVTGGMDRLGNPAVALIHIGKRSGRLVINDIASAYGLEDFEKREKVNPTKLLYVRNKKDLTASTTPNLLKLAGVVQKAEGLGIILFTKDDVVKHLYWSNTYWNVDVI